MSWLVSREGRKWIYGVCLAAVPLLVAYGVIDGEVAPLLVAVIAAIVAPSLALANLTPPLDEPYDLSTVPEED
jgi:hypothetical protein